MNLGRLERLDLREYWKKEDSEFTPWLAKEENIILLSEAIGIELQVQSQEESVGPFRADILCKDTTNEHYVLIENQLERTDHTHLGQLMTYAAGLDAVTIIWIAQKFTEEHRAALDWLNRITDETFNFFGIEIELYKIGDSLAAPMFNLVSKPNDWSKLVKKSAASQNLTDIKQLQQEYWAALKSFIEKEKCIFKMQSPPPQHWTNIALGRSNFNLSAQVNSRESVISIVLNITGDDAKENYEKLFSTAFEQSKINISPEIGWDKMDGRKMACVILKSEGDMNKRSDWERQFRWFKIYIEKFIQFYKPIIRNI